MKTVEVQAKFPEVVVDNYAFEVTETASASTVKAAANRALGAVLKNPSLKRKRFTLISLEIVVAKEKD